MLEESKIDPTLVNKQMDDVLRLESLLKKKQLNTLVAIKNELTSPQQKLLEIKGPLGLTGTTGYGNFNSAPLATSNIKVGTATTVSPNVSIRMDNGNPENTPLYIIDGQVIKDGELKNINPNDIESISVLKDKSATDTYGDKGKNGVIIITLKKNSKYYFQKK
jgi:TonB-dependent SusC/RagA subfamily outer membrane receptor